MSLQSLSSSLLARYERRQSFSESNIDSILLYLTMFSHFTGDQHVYST